MNIRNKLILTTILFVVSGIAFAQNNVTLTVKNNCPGDTSIWVRNTAGGEYNYYAIPTHRTKKIPNINVISKKHNDSISVYTIWQRNFFCNFYHLNKAKLNLLLSHLMVVGLQVVNCLAMLSWHRYSLARNLALLRSCSFIANLI